MNLATEAEHETAVKEFRMLTPEEETNYACLLVMRDAIHTFKEMNGQNPGPRPRWPDGCRWSCLRPSCSSWGELTPSISWKLPQAA